MPHLSPADSHETQATLSQLRQTIDKLDQTIVATLVARLKTSAQVAALKSHTGMTLAKDETREAFIIKKVTDSALELGASELAAQRIAKIYCDLLDHSRVHQLDSLEDQLNK